MKSSILTLRAFAVVAVSAVTLVLAGCPGSDEPASSGEDGSAGAGGSSAGAGGSDTGSGGNAAGAAGNFGGVPAKVNGVITCNAPLDFSFQAKASEVYRFKGTMTVPAMAAAGANAAATLLLDGQPVEESSNQVGFAGAAYPDSPVDGERWYSMRKGGAYTVRFSVEQCAEVTVQAYVDRMEEAATNLTKETAAALVPGSTPHRGTLNCEEERWFTVSPAAGQTLHLSLTGKATLDNSGGGALLSVLDAAGEALMESGNPIDVGSDFAFVSPAATTRDVTFAQAGLYHLKLAFWNGCTISHYEMGVSPP